MVADTIFWTEDQEVRLMNKVKKYPWLYNSKHRSYRDKGVRQRTWIEIASSFEEKVTGKWHEPAIAICVE